MSEDATPKYSTAAVETDQGELVRDHGYVKIDPFGDSREFEVTDKAVVDASQLRDEIAKAGSVDVSEVQVAVSCEDIDADGSAANPLYVFVQAPASVKDAVIEKAVKAHSTEA